MHLLYLIDSLMPGGAEQSLAALAPHFVAGGMRLDVAFLSDRPGLQEILRTAGAELFSLTGGGGRLQAIRRVARLLSDRRPDLVHTTLFEADLAGRIAGALARIPVVSSIVNVAYGAEQVSDPRLRTWKVRSAQIVDLLSARAVVRFHALSQYLADVMSRRLLISRSRIDVIPRGRDPKQLGIRTTERRARIRAEIGVGSETPLLLGASRQEYQKGLDILLKAFHIVSQQVPSARLMIAGREGNHTPELQSLLHQLGLEDSVRFLGLRHDVPDLLCGADVFCLPSRWEGLGSVVLEAMALEAPIVATDLPAVREIVLGEGTAKLVRPGSPGAFARAALDTLNDPGLASRQAQQARDRFLRLYTSTQVAQEMFAFYERAVSS